MCLSQIKDTGVKRQGCGYCRGMMTARVITTILRLRRPGHASIVVMTLAVIMRPRSGHHAAQESSIMATCTSCGSDVTGKKFCPECGTPVQLTAVPTASGSAAPATTFCSNCGKQSTPGEHFCSNCV